jgi:hypothetical protein
MNMTHRAGRVPASGVPTLKNTPHTHRQPTAAETPALATAWQPRAPVAPRVFDKSDDGTPLFRQGDPEWATQRMGGQDSIHKSGCALVAMAMLLSKQSGRQITPSELNQFLTRRQAWRGTDHLDWQQAASARGLTGGLMTPKTASIDSALDAGHPVIVGVHYKSDSHGATDHYVTVTAKGTDDSGAKFYKANDPGTGQVIQLSVDRKDRLTGDGTNMLGRYRSTNKMFEFNNS